MQVNGMGQGLRRKLARIGKCTVLELGCGHGLPGITAALLGSDVHFQVGMCSNSRCVNAVLSGCRIRV